MHGVGRWFLPGAGVGWLAALVFLARVLPRQVNFVDDPLVGGVVLVVIPGLLAGVAAVVLAAIVRRILRQRRDVSEVTVTRLRRLSISLLLVTLFLGALSVLAPDRRLHTRLMVFGIDGASPDVVDALVPLDQLPGITELKVEGASGELRSIEPMLSPIVWTTIATGQPLERHGIHGFRVTSPACQAARFWDVLEDRGMTVGLYKWLVTYPPREGSGFMVPGWLATGPETVPRDLEFARAYEQQQRSRARAGAAPGLAGGVGFAMRSALKGVRLSTLTDGALFAVRGVFGGDDELRMAEAHRLRARIDLDLFLALLERYDPDVATFTYYPTDAVAHRMWKYYEPDKFGGVVEDDGAKWDAIPAVYRQADSFLIELRRRLPNDVNLVVLSDHGMCAAGTEGGAAASGLRTAELQRLLDEWGASTEVAQLGMKATVAVADGSALPADEVERRLAEVTFDGKPLLQIETLAPAMLGLTLAVQGHLAARIAEPVTLPDGGATTLEPFLRTKAGTSGVHHERGVLYAVGPQIAPGVTIEGADLYDVAPTLLAVMGAPPAGDMEGQVLDALFLEPPAVGEGPASYGDLVRGLTYLPVSDSAAGEDAVQQRLQALGYVEPPREAP